MNTDAPIIKSIFADQALLVTIIWKNGAESTVDVGDYVKTYAVFAPLLANDAEFKKVRLGEWGWCAHWSDDIEISSDMLWKLALEQGSAWLRTWRNNHKMAQSEEARALGVSPRMWRYYEAGTHLLPKTARLACLGFDVREKAA